MDRLKAVLSSSLVWTAIIVAVGMIIPTAFPSLDPVYWQSIKLILVAVLGAAGISINTYRMLTVQTVSDRLVVVFTSGVVWTAIILALDSVIPVAFPLINIVYWTAVRLVLIAVLTAVGITVQVPVALARIRSLAVTKEAIPAHKE